MTASCISGLTALTLLFIKHPNRLRAAAAGRPVVVRMVHSVNTRGWGVARRHKKRDLLGEVMHPLPCCFPRLLGSLPRTFVLYIPPLYTRCPVPLLYLTTVVKDLTSSDFEGTQSLTGPDCFSSISPPSISYAHTHTHSHSYQTHAHMLNNIFKTQTASTFR